MNLIGRYQAFFGAVLATTISFSYGAQEAPGISSEHLREALITIQENLSNLNYYTAQEVAFQIPGTEQELFFDWGFGGSGDLFTPMPSVKLQMRTAQKKYYDDAGSVKGKDFYGRLSDMVMSGIKSKLKDAIVNQGDTSIINSLISWKLGSLELFTLKLLMLAKSAWAALDDIAYKFELARLMVRLSLADDAHFFDKSKNLSDYFPEEVLEILTDLFPDFIEGMNVAWNCLKGKELAYVQAGVINASGATQQLVVTFVSLCKDYVAARKDFFEKNPDQAKIYTQECEAKNKRMAKTNQFLLSDFGVASKKRLSEALAALEGQPAGVSIENIDAMTKERDAAKTRLIACEKNLANEKAKHDKLNEIFHANSAKAGLQEYLKKVAQDRNGVSLKIKELESEKSELEVIIQKLPKKSEESLDKKPVDCSKLNEAIAKFLALEASLRKAGEEIPVELNSEINSLREQLAAVAQQNTDSQMAFEEALAKRDFIAQIYRKEATVLQEQLDKSLAKIRNIVDVTEQKYQKFAFEPIMHGITAYIEQLLERAKALGDENKQASTLKNYRTKFAGQKIADIAPEMLEKIDDLESQVGYIADGRTAHIFDALISQNIEIKYFFSDINGSNAAFSAIKERLIQVLATIMNQSELHQLMCCNIISSYIPQFTGLIHAIARRQPVLS